MILPQLHLASMYSFNHGTASPERLVEAAAAEGARIAALTDRDGVSGAVRHIRACLKAGISPVVGVELCARDEAEGPEQPQSITVLAHGRGDGRGWAGLVRLVSALHARPRGRGRARRQGPRRPVLPCERTAAFLLDEAGEPAATVLLGPDSDVGRAVLAGDRARALERLDRWRGRLPGGIAVEIVCHFARPGLARSIVHAARMLELAERAGVPAVLTNEVRHLHPEDVPTGDVLDAVAGLQPLRAHPLPLSGGHAWRKPAAEMERLARSIVARSELPRRAAGRLLDDTVRLAERCALDPVVELGWRRPKVPELHVLGVRDDPVRALRNAALRGIPERYPTARRTALERVHERLRHEIAEIARFGFAPYFLTVADVVARIRALGIRHQARGSGAGSLVNHLLGVSAVDPFEHDLLFERFLGAHRSTLPDIDLDVESGRRGEVYREIFRAYGEHRTALLAMGSTRRARGAVRDAGFALGIDEDRVDELVAGLHRVEASELRSALAERPELRQAAQRLREEPELELLVELAERLDRLPRNLSAHPCGVVLGDEGLQDLTPVQPAAGSGLPMSQFDKDDMDDLGLLKLDVLGVRTQSAIAHALDEIERGYGADAARAGGLDPEAPFVSPAGRIDPEAIPRDDEAVFEAIRTGHTIGVFQLDSPGQRELVGRMQPDRYSDIIASISLFRPGPLRAGLLDPFVDAKLGLRAPERLHPLFDEVLADSYGAVLYHEQVLRILQLAMDVTLAEADGIRRAMERNPDAPAAAFRERARERRDEQGRRLFSDQDVERIWRVLRSFGAFGFCRAHAASFAITSYQSAWLKTRYPVEFMAGLLEHEPGMYPRRMLMSEARRIGIPLLPPDVNASGVQYLVEALGPEVRGIRISLRAVHGITEEELERILTGRPFRSLGDFRRRAAPSRPLLERLASIGALDSIAGEPGRPAGRGEVIARVRGLLAAERRGRGPDPRQPALFDELPVTAEAEETAPGRSELEVLSAEVTRHALDPYRPMLAELGVREAAELAELPDRSPVRVAGVRVATQSPPGRRGSRLVAISLDDGTGCAETRFAEEAQRRCGPLLFGTELLIVQGTTRRSGARGVTVRAEGARDLKTAWREWSAAHAAQAAPSA